MDWNSKENKKLIQAILGLKTAYEARGFLRDLMTTKEIEEFGKRLQVAEMLSENIPYTTIEKKTGLSSTTIARVSKWLSNGMGGYKSVIKRLHHHSNFVARGD
ncbi:MAG: YerC/YecD family TrpR-related protein [bacterium]|nr:YerC/YecD family TrpR-related protein [bacterium]